MYTIAIWTNINSRSGFGHFYRMLGLYEKLAQNNFNVCYFTNTQYITLESVNIVSHQTDNINEINNFLITQGVKILIIDNYDVILSDLNLLKNHFCVLYFDAKFDNPNVQAIINFNPYACNRYPIRHEHTDYFLGLSHMVFRNSMKQLKKNTLKKDAIFISIGGSDHERITLKIIDFLPQKNLYHIVLGRGCEQNYYDDILQKAKKFNLNFQIHQHPKNYFEILSECKKAIVSCSTTTYEMIYFDKPFFCIHTVENQNEIKNYLKQNGILTINKDTLNEIKEIMDRDAFFKLQNDTFACSETNELFEYLKKEQNERI